MLFDMMSGEPVTSVPYKLEYEKMLKRMDPAEVQRAKACLNQMIDGTTIQTAGWMPGNDWTNTPFQPIYEKAARYSREAAARCFGLLVWEVFMDRPEKWTSGRFENNGEPLHSRTYFQIS